MSRPSLDELARELRYHYRAHEKAREVCLALRAYEMSNSRRLPDGHRSEMMSAESALGTARKHLDAALLAIVEAVEVSKC